MAFVRHEDSIEKYIQSIKADHLAMIENPLIILRNLLRYYFQEVPAKFTFFNQKAHAIRIALRALYYDELNKPTRLGLEDVIQRVEQVLSLEEAPLSSELEAMWIAFYKYYSPLLPIPAATSPFAAILHQARHYTAVMRSRAASHSIATMLDASAEPVERCAAAYEFKHFHNGTKLKLTTHFKLIDQMLLHREWYLSRDLKRTMIGTPLKIEEWAETVNYLIRCEGRKPGNTIADYLTTVLGHLNRNNFPLNLDLQKLIIKAIAENCSERTAILVLADFLAMNMIAEECKLEMTHLLHTKFKTGLVQYLHEKKDGIARLLSVEPTRAAMLDALLDECTGGAKHYPREMKFCQKVLMQLTSERPAEAEKVLKRIFDYVVLGDFDEFITFIIESSVPGDCRKHAKSRLKAMERYGFTSPSLKLAYLKLHDNQFLDDEINQIWQEIIEIITNTGECKTYDAHPLVELFKFLEPHTIPQAYLQAVRLATTRAVLTGQFQPHQISRLTPKILQLLPMEEHEAFAADCFEVLDDGDEDKRHAAFIMLATINKLTASRRFTAMTRVLGNLNGARCAGHVWIRDHLVALAQSDNEIEYVFNFIKQQFNNLDDYYYREFLEFMIHNIPLKPHHLCQLIAALLAILEEQIIQAGAIFKIDNTLQLLLTIKIPPLHRTADITAVISKGINLLFKLFGQYGFSKKSSYNYKKYLNDKPLTLLLKLQA